MDSKIKIGLALVVIMLLIPLANIFLQTKEKTVDQTKQVETEKHVKIVQTTTKKPDGEETTVVVTTKDSETQSASDKHTTEIVKPAPKLLVSAILATKPELPLVPIYGISVSKQILGPVTVGGILLTDKTVGVTLGLEF